MVIPVPNCVLLVISDRLLDCHQLGGELGQLALLLKWALSFIFFLGEVYHLLHCSLIASCHIIHFLCSIPSYIPPWLVVSSIAHSMILPAVWNSIFSNPSDQCIPKYWGDILFCLSFPVPLQGWCQLSEFVPSARPVSEVKGPDRWFLHTGCPNMRLGACVLVVGLCCFFRICPCAMSILSHLVLEQCHFLRVRTSIRLVPAFFLMIMYSAYWPWHSNLTFLALPRWILLRTSDFASLAQLISFISCFCLYFTELPCWGSSHNYILRFQTENAPLGSIDCDTAQLGGRAPTINSPLDLSQHANGISEIEQYTLKEHREWVGGYDMVPRS